MTTPIYYVSKVRPITSTDIINGYNRLIDEIMNPVVINSLRIMSAQQSQSEETLIKTTNACDPTMVSDLRDHMSGLEPRKLKNITSGQFQNIAAMKATTCLTDSIFYSTPRDVGSTYRNNRIRMYIHNLRLIGDQSGSGYALLADLGDNKDMFVVKSPQTPSNNGILIHELVVGLYGTNKLRKYIPNFAYVYGGFKSSPPFVDTVTRKVISWSLHNENAVNYVLYENISPAITMTKYVQTCTGTEFVNAYIQILYALRLALKLTDFTHYDLHADNILIRENTALARNSEFQIKYETERHTTEYINTKVIPTIIDYGLSHIKMKQNNDNGTFDQDYGASGYVQYSIFAYRSWIMNDAYKLLMFCLLSALKANNTSVVNEASKIFAFFNNVEDPVNAVNLQLPILFSFPLTDETNAITIDNFLTYIRSVCNCNFMRRNSNSKPILDCETLCLSEEEVFKAIGVDPKGPISTPDNVLEFYDLTLRLQREGGDEDRNRIVREFQYTTAMTTHIDKINTSVRNLTILLQNVKLIDVSVMPLEYILDYDTMMVIREMYITVASIVDKTVQLRFDAEIGMLVAKSFNDDYTFTFIDDIIENFNNTIRPGLDNAKRIFGNNHRYLNGIQNNPTVINASTADVRLQWYWTERNLFDVVFGHGKK